MDAVAGGSPYGRHHDRSSGSMLLTGKLAGAAQLGIGRHRRRAVPNGSPHGGPRAGSPEWRAARDSRHNCPGSPSARRGPRPRMDGHAAGARPGGRQKMAARCLRLGLSKFATLRWTRGAQVLCTFSPACLRGRGRAGEPRPLAAKRRRGVIGLDAVAGGSPYGRHHERSSGCMLLTGKLAAAAQLCIGCHRWRAVPMARLTAGRGPASRNGGRHGTTGTSGWEHLPCAGPRPRMDDHEAGVERQDHRSSGPDGAAAGARGRRG